MIEPSAFQTMAMERLADLLARRSLPATFTAIDSSTLYYVSTFVSGPNRFRLEIYDDQIGLDMNEGHVDSEIFSFADDEAKLTDFCRRLDRAMNTGEWYGDEDPSIGEAARHSLEGCLGSIAALWRSPFR